MVSKLNSRLVNNNGNFNPPQDAIKFAGVFDGNGPYPIIARTKWGFIPGKSNACESWYAYHEKEHDTNNFDWIVVDGICLK